ncbi:hypothetical protein [Aquimarina macrocephali]|uniref:hypothetical protein n=1 Tax=Aquimarina macrocephali TaxID=666563 RepID=UPI000462F387|nr:hypothetical protein [Aquimarina macrocephali]
MEGKSKDKGLIEDLHKLIEEKKEIDRISWDNLGDLIGYSGVGLKKALKIRSLSLTKLEEIIIKLGLIKEATNFGLKISGRKSYDLSNKNENLRRVTSKDNIIKNEEDFNRLESLCLSNWEALMKRDSFKDKVELTAMKDINKILDERLAIILKNLKQ